MTESPKVDVTALLCRMQAGEEDAKSEIVEFVAAALHARAVQLMNRNGNDLLLQPTALVNEVWLRLFDSEAGWNDRNHFLAVASTAMRRIIIDHARRGRTENRQAEDNQPILDELVGIFESDDLDLLSLNEVLTELESFDECAAKVIELRFFAGASISETASCLEISERTVARRFAFAKSWLHNRLKG